MDCVPSRMEDLWAVVQSIPVGRVMSYGEVGRLLKEPTSGRMVGRWMAQCPDGLPWWRVVAKSGHLPVGKRDPALAFDQAAQLAEEGVAFEGDLVAAEAFWHPDEA